MREEDRRSCSLKKAPQKRKGKLGDWCLSLPLCNSAHWPQTKTPFYPTENPINRISWLGYYYLSTTRSCGIGKETVTVERGQPGFEQSL